MHTYGVICDAIPTGQTDMQLASPTSVPQVPTAPGSGRRLPMPDG